MSLNRKIIKKLVTWQLSGWSRGSLVEQRARQEKFVRYVRLPKEIRCQPLHVGSVPAEWIEAPKSDSGVILYLHGGAYTLGSINVHREWIARLVTATRTRCLAIDYRLAPEHPFPAALKDTLTAYRWLLQQGIDPSQIVLAGDSAGGGLALATLISLREAEESLPAGAICISPWTDLSLGGASVQQKTALDPILDPASLKMYAEYYAGEKALTDPLLSPLYADLRDLPPLLIQVGTDEILLDDATRIAKRAQSFGVDVTLSIWDEMFHVFQMIPFLPETKQALGQITAFMIENTTMKRVNIEGNERT